MEQEELPDIHPIVSPMPSGKLASLQTQKLMSRLLQALDEENSDLDGITAALKKIAINSGIDYNFWKSKDITQIINDELLLENDSESAQSNSNENLSEGRERELEIEKENEERAQLLLMLHRERKITERYEEMISSYQELIKYVLVMARKRREEIYGISADRPIEHQEDNKEGSHKVEMKPLKEIKVNLALKERADAMLKNAELLKKLRTDREKRMEILRNSLTLEAEELLKKLDASIKDKDESS